MSTQVFQSPFSHSSFPHSLSLTLSLARSLFSHSSATVNGEMAAQCQLSALARSERVAVKKLPYRTHKERAAALSEVEVMSAAVHPCVVGYLGSFLEPTKGEMWMVLPYLDGGSLYEALRQSQFEVEEIAYVADLLVAGLSHLHSAGLSLSLAIFLIFFSLHFSPPLTVSYSTSFPLSFSPSSCLMHSSSFSSPQASSTATSKRGTSCCLSMQMSKSSTLACQS